MFISYQIFFKLRQPKPRANIKYEQIWLQFNNELSDHLQSIQSYHLMDYHDATIATSKPETISSEFLAERQYNSKQLPPHRYLNDQTFKNQNDTLDDFCTTLGDDFSLQRQGIDV